MKDFLPIVCGAPLFAGISAQEAAAVLSCLSARTESYPKGAYILRAGDTTQTLGLLLSGEALILQEDFWGNRNILSRVSQGDIFAETFACVPGAVLTVSVVAETPATVLLLETKRLLTLCPNGCAYHSRLLRNLLTALADKNLRFNEKLTHIGQRTTRAKLISYLSAQASRCGAPVFEIPFNRQQLADYLSVERSGLSQELCKMRDEGLLAFHKSQFWLKKGF